MSSKSVNFFPDDESSENTTPGAPASASEPEATGGYADLAALRESWSTQFQDLPAMPKPSPQQGGGSSKTEAKPIPELPSLGAMASRAVLSAEGHDELFDQGEQSPAAQNKPSRPRPLPVGEIPLSRDLEPFTFTTSAGPLPSGHPGRKRPALDIPQIPEASSPFTAVEKTAGETSAPLAEMPAMESTPSAEETFVPSVGDRPASFFSPEPPARQEAAAEQPAERATAATSGPTPAPADRDTAAKDGDHLYTDQDLQNALRPLIEPSVDQFLYTPTHSIHSYLEPMLRSTVRRAIAEQMEDASPFRDVSGWDKFAWKLRALMSSRSYEEILFDHTRRYQVEEVFLLRPKTRSLISYASHDPARHVKPGKVEGTVKKIAAKIAHKAPNDSSPIKWEDKRQLLVRNGKHSTLVAIVHGSPNAILRSDLDYAIRQAEDRFGKTLEDNSDIHLQILQPLLEGCLLIQSVASPN